MNPHIVIVTYNWPPRNAIGTQRPLSWARYWPGQGARVTVLTAEKQAFDAPLDLSVPELPGVTVIEIPYLGQSRRRAMGIFRVNALRRRIQDIKKLFGGALGNVDFRRKWANAARGRAVELARAAEIVVSTHGPSSAHLIAAEMKRANPRLRWIADYRDFWHNNSHVAMSDSQRPAERKLEQVTIAGADVLTTVSAELGEQLAAFSQKPVYVVENGFDVPEAEVRDNLSAKRRRADGPIRIVYTGVVYRGLRDPEPLFRALAEMCEAGEISPADIVCDFYGDKLQPVAELAADRRYADFVRLHGHVSRGDVLQLQKDADLLLVLESADPKTKGVLTGKIFEYMASGTPILSVGPGDDSAIAKILDLTSTGCSGARDEERIKAVVRGLVAGNPPAWYRPRIDLILEYSRERRAALLYSIVMGSAAIEPMRAP